MAAMGAKLDTFLHFILKILYSAKIGNIPKRESNKFSAYIPTALGSGLTGFVEVAETKLLKNAILSESEIEKSDSETQPQECLASMW